MFLLGDTVAAAGAGLVLAVGEDLLALVELDLFVGPKDAVAHAVGNVDQSIPVEINDSSVLDVEVGVMGGDDGIMAGGRFKFLGAFHASRNHGVGIEAAPFRQAICQRHGDAGGVRKDRCGGSGIGDLRPKLAMV